MALQGVLEGKQSWSRKWWSSWTSRVQCDRTANTKVKVMMLSLISAGIIDEAFPAIHYHSWATLSFSAVEKKIINNHTSLMLRTLSLLINLLHGVKRFVKHSLTRVMRLYRLVDYVTLFRLSRSSMTCESDWTLCKSIRWWYTIASSNLQQDWCWC